MDNKKEKTTKILAFLVSIMIVAIAIMGYVIYDMKKEKKIIIVEKQTVTNEKDKLKQDYTDLLNEYKDLQSSNDVLNEKINIDKERIEVLIKEIDDIKNYSYSVEQKYKKELNSLREIMRSYVYQIDSLDLLNKQLIAENKKVTEDKNRVSSAMEKVIERNDELEIAMEVASIMKTANIGVKFLTKKNAETTTVRKIEKLEVDFTLVANDFAESGNKRIYLRIIDPDNFVMSNSAAQTFLYREKHIVYSAFRDVTYENRNLDVAVFYEVSERLVSGKYNVELYADGNIIGQTTFSIK